MTRPQAIATAARLLKLGGLFPDPPAAAVIAVELLPSDLPEALLLGELRPHLDAAIADAKLVSSPPSPLAVALLLAPAITAAIGTQLPAPAPKPRAKPSRI